MNPGEKLVLLVEDDPNDVALVQRVFDRFAVANRLEVVRDGAAALQRLGCDRPETGPLDVSLVLLDLKLPKVHGLEVLRRIREDPRTHRLRVVILTSSFADEERLASYDYGANSFVRKPIEFAKFAEAIKEVGLYWLIFDAGPPPG
ncbi:MAG: response regulator [Myxococcota bacterium]